MKINKTLKINLDVIHFKLMIFKASYVPLCFFPIVYIKVMCLVAKPWNGSEAKGGLVMIQMLLLFKCKSLCYCAN